MTETIPEVENNVITLNDLLHLDTSEPKKIDRWWITLSSDKGANNNKLPIDQWLERNEEDPINADGLGFSFHPYKYIEHKNTGVVTKSKWLREGDYVVIAAKMPRGKSYLLISVNKVTKIHYGNNPYAEREPVEKYRKWFGRIIFKVVKNRQYAFHLTTFLDKSIVQQILPESYDKCFPGYENVGNISFKRLYNHRMSDGRYGSTWYNELRKYNGVYCLRNADEHKLYIGSAYGADGLAQRLDCYMKTNTGGNEKLNVLYNKLFQQATDAGADDKTAEEAAENYFRDNFYYTILEIIPKNVTKEDVIARENYWKEVFDSRNPDVGYNKN